MSNVINLQTSTKPAPISWVESLFARMQGMYGNKFIDMWRDTDIEMVKALWAEAMGGMSNEELKRGYAALMTQDWPPSLPAYVKMCRPTIDATKAYHEAVEGCRRRAIGGMGVWSSPAIYWAAVPLSFDLLSQSYAQIKTRWELALSKQLEKGEWEPIPEPMLALPEPGKGELSKESAAKMIDELGAAGAAKTAASATDHKIWAKRIIEQSKKASHGLSALQIRFAKEALAA